MLRSVLLLSAAALLLAAPASAQDWHRHFVFGTGAKPSQTDTAVATPALYGFGTGFGFEGDAPTLSADSAGGKPFFFSFAAPEGNYKVTVTLGGDQASDTTVKAELRRLMLETVAAPAGGAVTKTFIVNVRTPDLITGGQVRLKAPRESVDEARERAEDTMRSAAARHYPAQVAPSLEAHIRIVHGTELIADSSDGEERMCDRFEDAVLRRGHLDVDFVRLELDERLAGADRIAGLFQPLGDTRIDDRLAHFRDNDVHGH